MTEDQRKHLDYIQSIVTRMNSNSFLIKGWSITITSALLALAASTKNLSILFIAIIPMVAFWILDAFYLQYERKFRGLYEKVIEAESKIVVYDLNIDKEFLKIKKYSFWEVFKSDTLKYFYLPLLGLAMICFVVVFFSIKQTNAITEIKVKMTDTLKVTQVVPIENKKILKQDSCCKKTQCRYSIKK